MRGLTFVTLFFAGSAFAMPNPFEAESRVTLPKANEYASGDCSGALNYGHRSYELGDVTMDDSTHSVYLDHGNKRIWVAYNGKSKNGGDCTGKYLGALLNGCHNLDHPAGLAPGRVRCVRLLK